MLRGIIERAAFVTWWYGHLANDVAHHRFARGEHA